MNQLIQPMANVSTFRDGEYLQEKSPGLNDFVFVVQVAPCHGLHHRRLGPRLKVHSTCTPPSGGSNRKK